MSREMVLIVDDEPSVLHFVAAVLISRDYAVLEARDGHSALQLALGHSGPIDLLLADARMPAMSGLELCERLGKVRPETRYLLMSGSLDGGERSGIPFLSKPFDIPELLRSVRQALRSAPISPNQCGSHARRQLPPEADKVLRD
jgi:two-component system, cell cycle sensor histidine kinase and response regulator CckA